MGSKIAVCVAALVLAIPLLIGAGIAGIISTLFGSSGSSGSLTCTPDGAPTGTVPGLTAEQMGNAATIVAVGKQMGVPEPGWVVAIAAAMQESKLQNLPYGDRDSLGLFQQRPSMGWGTPQQVTTPTYAATKFFEHLTATPNWQKMSVNDAAQTVQGSGFPNAYAQHEEKARAIVAAVSGVRCQPAPATTGTGDCNNIQAATAAAMTAINYACGQRGLPYVWGGNGPQNGDNGFDCSGLTKAAYEAAGISLPRTADAQYSAGNRVPDGQPLLPGDLVYYGPTSNIRHVGLYIGNGKMLNAPDFGQSVQIDNYRYPGDDYAGATRPAH
ncbi:MULTISPECIES: C40 family peptidase [Amycolatopsis]|uniref:C40 family peptidase n=2 Tax=Amycolatopsis TaxID=1813 RepID=A0A2N3WF31_9PSEU|nr:MULTISPECIES: C40 family peptidase [Amycolatopsis]MBB2505971.1 C40 family peptidase [Amycolatopsis echigonensis]PKV92441.1 cell wall-associated NlpC family hydrolase [Amycolatopsis niigatensis]TVT16771.1 NlpC/P60 family protein [Amycolatopsis acidiphila]UIJ59627.1 C40 family peptidase [Amycolatopsis acidiphila]GHG80974.1 lipoprotein [Amycolatopsis acidiphila]